LTTYHEFEAQKRSSAFLSKQARACRYRTESLCVVKLAVAKRLAQPAIFSAPMKTAEGSFQTIQYCLSSQLSELLSN
jgi:hypothetical protein